MGKRKEIKIFCILGPSGSGKSYVTHLMIHHPYLEGAVKYLPEYTTRPKSTLRNDDESHVCVSYNKYVEDATKDDIAAINNVEIKDRNGIKIDTWRYYYRKSDILNATTDLVCQSDIILVPQLIAALETRIDVRVVPVYIWNDEVKRTQRILLEESKKDNPSIPELIRRYEIDRDQFKPFKALPENNFFGCYQEPKENQFIGYCIKNDYDQSLTNEILKLYNHYH